MASIPQFYSDYTWPTDNNNLYEFSTPTLAAGVSGADHGAVFGTSGPIWCQESLMPLFDNGAIDQIVSSESDMTSSVRMSSFPGLLGTSELAVPALSDYKMDLCGMAGVDNFGAGFQPTMCEFGEECCGFLEDFKPVYPAAGENWGIQGNQQPLIEESNIKVGRYSEEERKERILRYLKKRNQRNFNKTIKYACRKTLADRRVRVRGRFARNSTDQLCEEEIIKKKKDDPLKEEEFCCSTEAIQIKTDEDDWLQEAMASLMYLPYIAG
ncbi:zinc finger protein CONSTANS-LIKE 4 [Fagus crenata]